jgi:hypothetical protein
MNSSPPKKSTWCHSLSFCRCRVGAGGLGKGVRKEGQLRDAVLGLEEEYPLVHCLAFVLFLKEIKPKAQFVFD